MAVAIQEVFIRGRSRRMAARLQVVAVSVTVFPLDTCNNNEMTKEPFNVPLRPRLLGLRRPYRPQSPVQCPVQNICHAQP